MIGSLDPIVVLVADCVVTKVGIKDFASIPIKQ